MTHRPTLIAWLAACLLLFAASARGTAVTVTASGTVTEISYATQYPWTVNPFPGLAVGDLVTATFSYDTTATYGPVPLGCCTVGYSVPSYSVQGDSFGFGGYAAGNFSDSHASIWLPGSGRYFPEWSSAISLDFVPNYFSAIPPNQMDTSALVAGTIWGSFAQLPYLTSSFRATVTSVTSVSAVPLPSAAILFGSALLGFIGRSASRKLAKSSSPHSLAIG